jgi:hypothetical protein
MFDVDGRSAATWASVRRVLPWLRHPVITFQGPVISVLAIASIQIATSDGCWQCP